MNAREIVKLAEEDKRILDYDVVLVTHLDKTYQGASRVRVNHEKKILYIDG